MPAHPENYGIHRDMFIYRLIMETIHWIKRLTSEQNLTVLLTEIALRAKIARLIALESLFQLLFHRDTHPSSRMIWFPCHNYYNSSTNYVCIETKFVSNSSRCFYWTMLCSKILIHLHSRWMICFTLKRETRTKRLSAKKHIQNY